MEDYTVTWEIQLHAASPEEAAERALEIQRDLESLATCFVVRDKNGKEYQVDL